MKTILRVGLAAVAGFAWWLVAGTASAQTYSTTLPAVSVSTDVTGAAVIQRYNEAVVSARMCENRPMNQAEEDRVAMAEALAAGSSLPTAGASLDAEHNARGAMAARILSFGCADTLVQDRLAFYHTSVDSILK